MGGSRDITAKLRDQVFTLHSRITDRDHYVLALIARHRVLTTDHIQAAAFDSVVATRHRMSTLHNLGAVARFRPRPVRGSAPWHYVLDTAGAMVVAGESGDERAIVRASRVRRDRQLAIEQSSHLNHLLEVNSFFTALLAHARVSSGRARLRHWRNEAASAQWVDDHLSRDLTYEARKPLLVRPDGMGTWHEDGVTVRFFVEIDTGTEPLTRLREKLIRYGVLAEELGEAMPWVLFSLPGPKREKNVRAALTRHGSARMLPVATAHRDKISTPAEPIWRPLTDGVARLRLAHLGSVHHHAGTRMEVP